MIVSQPCPQCGLPAQETVQAYTLRIQQLEQEVQILTQKASAAADKLAGYEDELRKYRVREEQRQQQQIENGSGKITRTSTEESSVNGSGSGDLAAATQQQQQQQQRLSLAVQSPPQQPTQPSQPPKRQPPTNRFSSYFSRRTTPATSNAASPLSGSPMGTTTTNPSDSHRQTNPAPNEDDPTLLSILTREQALRQEAESRLTQMNSEIEDLSATLFQQAGEMVATERRARAALEERVKTLERRDGEKRKRLERLESALGRIERVKAVLSDERERGRVVVGEGVGDGFAHGRDEG